MRYRLHHSCNDWDGLYIDYRHSEIATCHCHFNSPTDEAIKATATHIHNQYTDVLRKLSYKLPKQPEVFPTGLEVDFSEDF